MNKIIEKINNFLEKKNIFIEKENYESQVQYGINFCKHKHSQIDTTYHKHIFIDLGRSFIKIKIGEK